MSKTVFNLKNVHKLRGLQEKFDNAIHALVADCKARPAIQQKREIVLKIQFLPDKQDPDDIVVGGSLTPKIPAQSLEGYKMQSTHNDGLKFSPDSPLDPAQGDLYADDDE